MKDLRIRILKRRNRRLALLPSRRGSKENPIPILVEESLAVVIPDRVQLPRRAKPLPIGREALNIRQRQIVVRINLAKIIHARRNPRLESRLRNASDICHSREAPVVHPPNRDRRILERLRHPFQQIRSILRNVPPKEQSFDPMASKRRQCAAEIQIDRRKPTRIHIRLSLPKPQVLPSHPHRYAKTAPDTKPPAP